MRKPTDGPYKNWKYNPVKLWTPPGNSEDTLRPPPPLRVKQREQEAFDRIRVPPNSQEKK